jgi:hypothetical protein
LPTPVPAGTIRHTGGCLQPVLLRGRADYIDGGTGELIHRYTQVTSACRLKRGPELQKRCVGLRRCSQKNLAMPST